MMKSQHKPIQRYPIQRFIWQRLLDPVEELMKAALNAQNVSEEKVAWTHMRWDVPDITASWPKETPDRNIHAWLTGEWPTYAVNFEGAVWKDDDTGRRVLFYPLEPLEPGQIVAVGGTSNLKGKITRSSELQSKVTALVKSVVDATSYDLDKVPLFPLQPPPSP